MSLYTLTDVTTPETPASVEASIYDGLSALGVRTAGWKPGGVARAIITAVSHVFAAWTQWSVQIAKMGWLELAEGDWLTLVAKYDYGVERREATFAAGTVTIDNSGGGIYLFDPGDLIVTRSDGRAYRNTEAVTVEALETGVPCAIAALESGAASTALPGEIVGFETSYSGLSVTNALSIVGLDAETDAALKMRCRAVSVAASPCGPRDGYVYHAQKATRADGTPIGVTRATATTDNETGDVTVTVATASGALAEADRAAVDDYLQEHAAPLGVSVTTVAATPHVVPIRYQATYRTADPAVTDAVVAAAVAARLATFFASRPIGGDVLPPSATGLVYMDGLRAAIGSAHPSIFHVTMPAPQHHVVIAPHECPTLGAVTATLVRVTSGRI